MISLPYLVYFLRLQSDLHSFTLRVFFLFFCFYRRSFSSTQGFRITPPISTLCAGPASSVAQQQWTIESRYSCVCYSCKQSSRSTPLREASSSFVVRRLLYSCRTKQNGSSRSCDGSRHLPKLFDSGGHTCVDRKANPTLVAINLVSQN